MGSSVWIGELGWEELAISACRLTYPLHKSPTPEWTRRKDVTLRAEYHFISLTGYACAHFCDRWGFTVVVGILGAEPKV